MEPDDIIFDMDDLACYFHVHDIIEFGQMNSTAEVFGELVDLGYWQYFSDDDVRRIWKLSQAYCRQYGIIV